MTLRKTRARVRTRMRTRIRGDDECEVGCNVTRRSVGEGVMIQESECEAG